MMPGQKSAVRALLETRLSNDDPRGAALIDMTSDMVAHALRGDIHQYMHLLRRDLRKAIAAATGRDVESALADEPEFLRGLYPVDYSESLASHIRQQHWPRLQAGFERTHGNGWEKAKDDVWNALLADARPCGLNAWTDPNEAPRNTPGDNLLTTLFYFISFATLGDTEAMESMANLVRLLRYAIPIGERPQHDGHWLFVIHPVIR